MASCSHSLEEEPSTICMLKSLSGNCVELDGWSFAIPRYFSATILPTTCWKEISIKDARVRAGIEIEEGQEEPPERKTIEYLSKCKEFVAGNVLVHVVAKKAVDIVIQGGKVLVVCQILVADETGYSPLCSMNEGFQTIYSSVEVGDMLLLGYTRVTSAVHNYHKDLFLEEMMLDVNLSFYYHEVRYHRRINYNFNELQYFRFPSELHKNKKNVILPHCVQQDKIESLPRYFDMAGIITYVGRIQRTKIDQSFTVKYLERSKTASQSLPCTRDALQTKQINRFVLYRWIKIIDKDCAQPLVYKVHVNNMNYAQQEQLLPGEIVIVTNSEVEKRYVFPGPYLSSSSFSQIILGEDIIKYCSLWMNERVVDVLEPLLANLTYRSVLKRTDCYWSCGGTVMFKMSKQIAASWKDIHDLKRREIITQYIDARIVYVLQVNANNTRETILDDKSLTDKEKLTMVPDPFLKSEQETPCSVVYKLPIEWKHDEYDGIARTRDLVKKVVEENSKPHCHALLLPGQQTTENLQGLQDSCLELQHGPPYLVVCIRNSHSGITYPCIWRRANYELDEMLSKLKAAKGKQVNCAFDFFKLENETSVDCSLHDFVILNK